MTVLGLTVLIQIILNVICSYKPSIELPTWSVNALPNSTELESNDIQRDRVVMSMTAVPSEIPEALNNLLYEQSFVVDCIYLNIPYIQLRNKNALYPSTEELRVMFPQNGVIIHRILADAGPTTRYLGAIELESDPETLVITMDMDPWNFHNFTIQQLVEYAHFDRNSVWTVWGENMVWNPLTGYWAVDYWRYPLVIDDTFQKSWNTVEILRAVNGVAFRRKWFDDLWFNATDYHIGCFWTDDHWFSFNMERQGIGIKLIHDYEQSVKEREEKNQRRLGTLTQVNNELNSDSQCTINIMKRHRDIWVNVRDEHAE